MKIKWKLREPNDNNLQHCMKGVAKFVSKIDIFALGLILIELCVYMTIDDTKDVIYLC